MSFEHLTERGLRFIECGLKDGIQNLTKETQDLMKQQKTLMESMKQVGPLVETAKTMMEAMNNSGMQQMAGKFTGMMDMLGGMNK